VTRVKICGCRSIEQALVAAGAGADFVGLMFAPSSRRRVEVEDASEIVRALGAPLAGLEMETPPALYRTESDDLRSWFEHGASALERMLQRKRPLTVGVFAGNDLEEINEVVDECGIDLIQLSGGEPWGACLLANRQVIKALHVRGDDTASTALGRVEAGSAMAVMLDKADDAAFGGTGQALDWRVAGEIAAAMPVWLAGGLTPENVAEAVRTVRPWCVDVSSGVETEGMKNAAKIRAFVAAVRGVR
jgi:phosphoribosylanthranilate isomerase